MDLWKVTCSFPAQPEVLCAPPAVLGIHEFGIRGGGGSSGNGFPADTEVQLYIVHWKYDHCDEICPWKSTLAKLMGNKKMLTIVCHTKGLKTVDYTCRVKPDFERDPQPLSKSLYCQRFLVKQAQGCPLLWSHVILEGRVPLWRNLTCKRYWMLYCLFIRIAHVCVTYLLGHNKIKCSPILES